MHRFNSAIFREYDIRGIVDKNLSTEDAYWIGRSYAAKLGNGKIAIGRDGRISSPVLAKALMQGLIDSGIDIIDLGVCHTPLTYFAVFRLNLDGAIMVTGSHNPPDHNGFKIMLGKDSLHGDGIRQLAEINPDEVKNGFGEIKRMDIRGEYINKLISSFKSLPEALKIGWDPGNGASGEIVDKLVRELENNNIVINSKIDGTFPAHHPDPTVEENLEQLKQLIKDNSLDVGFAFDGDGDRVGVVDNKGRVIWGDQILAILCVGIAKKYHGASIVADVKTSKAVFDYIASLGLKPVMWKTGHSLVKSKMKELKSPLAGEMSAHIFFADDYYGFDDGVYAAIRFLKVMLETGKSAAELFDELPKMFSTKEIRLEITEEIKLHAMTKVKNALDRDKITYSAIDGVRAEFSQEALQGWFLIRASNTGSQIVARAEARSEKELDTLVGYLKKYLLEAGISY